MMAGFHSIHDEPLFNIPVLVIRCTADAQRNVLLVNKEGQRLLGFSPDSIKGTDSRSYADYIHPDDRDMVVRVVKQSCLESQPYKVQYRLLQGAENALWVCERGQVQLAEDGSPRFVDAIVADILDRKQYEDALLQSETKYRNLAQQLESIFDHLPALIFYKDTENRFIRVNKYIAQAYRKSKQELEGVSLYDLYPEDEARRYFLDDLDVINSGEEKLNIEEPWKTEDGLKWVSTSKIPFIDDTGKIQGVIGISMDITERKRADNLIQELIHRLELERDQARKSALIDGLTGIANRKGFDYTLEREYLRLQRSGASLSLIMIDIDHFKKYNDRYGHVEGDECLRKVALALQDSLIRTPDYLARFGGEEFVVILPDTLSNGAMVVAERLRKVVEALAIPNEDSDTSPYVTISLGVGCTRPRRDESPEHIIQLADAALYNAKDAGRNKVGLAGVDLGSADNQDDKQDGFIKLVWLDSFACGNQTIDDQHQNLFEIANNLLADISNAKHANKQLPDIQSLIAAIRIHFNDEEEILSTLGYPMLEKHKRRHTELLSKATELNSRCERGKLAPAELLGFLTFDVVSEHMLAEDQKFFPFMADHEVAG
jgi:diguanylate cyclase (GGDEF)-like protein/hemerythrin-like metal-binding protein/PAS domain S-box-containing protein